MGQRGRLVVEQFGGAGYVQTTVYETDTDRMIGLWRGASGAALDHALYLAADGKLYAQENGGDLVQIGAYAAGNKLRIERLSDGHVVYKKGNSTLYTSTGTSTGDLRVGTSLYTPGASLQNVVVSIAGGSARPVNWVDDTGLSIDGLAAAVTASFADVDGDGRNDAVLAGDDGRLWVWRGQADGSFATTMAMGTGIAGLTDLVKTSSVLDWDLGASSAQTFTGAGSVQTTVAETDKERMIGLSDIDSDHSQVSIDYAVYLAGNARYRSSRAAS